MNILVIGSGGREHTLAWKLHQSPKCENLFVAPGNAGTVNIATNIPINPGSFDEIGNTIIANNITLLVIGPEDPLVNGLRDYLENRPDISEELKIVGPGKSAARLEGSKDFSKAFMEKYGIPTGHAKTYNRNELDNAIDYIKGQTPPIVLKADGLAAGKGVIIAKNHDEAITAITEMLGHQKFGEASNKVLIERFLDGIELSVFLLTDGKDYLILPEAKDYKRIGEGDTGPNTGGMGSVSPVVFADSSFLQKVEERIVIPTINGLSKEGIPYSGFLFIGLMTVNGDPYVIEYNVRMGDPETQVVLPRVLNDFVDLLVAVSSGKLNSQKLEIDARAAATVVMASQGYPASYEKGKPLSGIDQVEDATVFHAGTKWLSGEIMTNGGRVLAVTGMGSDLRVALSKAYGGVRKIQWDGCQYRKDIGQDVLSLLL